MHHPPSHQSKAYVNLVIELAIDFVIMYLVMYAMIATLDHFRFNLNNVYMTMMMVTPMAVVMLIAMRAMFPSRRTNLAIGAVAVLLFAASFYGMRAQAAIGDKEFLKSMIPHHSGAILMCEQANLADPEIVALCRQIVKSQNAEIAQMEAILARY
ncbi:MAG: hypothetical protein K0S54_3146 [Alphaproteobacteria bacterium]|nr:hypothetical protein [Alphaproteobacteria bacterium]